LGANKYTDFLKAGRRWRWCQY